MIKICILYSISNDSIKYTNWHDGFTKAIFLLSKKYDIDMINYFDNKNILFDDYDFIFFKESFEGVIYNRFKTKFKSKNKLGLFISSSNIIPTDKQLNLYDVIFYETYWYYNYANLKRHLNAFHAFGIDTSVMKTKNTDKIYDVIFVGNICKYKRPEKILELDGKKICLGFKSDNDLILRLEKNNVIVKEFIEYEKLSEYYNKSKLCYIPCELHGGGERAVLEARSCGIDVKIENDNPKLKELCESDIYTSDYYANQIEKGLYNIFIRNIIKNTSYDDILKKLKNFKLNILEVGGMDGKTFDPLYNNISNNWNITILEPIPYQFNKLKQNYKNFKNVTLINKAFNYTSNKTKMYTIDEDMLFSNSVPLFANGISSFYNDRNSLGQNYWEGRGKKLSEINLNYNCIKDHIKEIEVECITIDDLNLDNVDILQSDTEGFDYNVLKIVLSKFKPFVIMFEWNNLPNNELENTKKLLTDYDIEFYNQDALCILKNITK